MGVTIFNISFENSTEVTEKSVEGSNITVIQVEPLVDFETKEMARRYAEESKQYANADKNVEVAPGLFSAKHYALKAKEVVSQSLTSNDIIVPSIELGGSIVVGKTVQEILEHRIDLINGGYF